MEILYKELKHTLKNWNDRNYLGKQIQIFFSLVRLEHGNIWGIPRHIYSVSCQSWRNLDEILL